MQSRGWTGEAHNYEHWVSRGNEESAVLIAVRKDVANSLECLFHEVHADHVFKVRGKLKMAKTRIQVCKVSFKQNIGHLGKDVVVAGVHGHCRTMKREWPEVWHEFWKRLAALVLKFGINFLAGDFNMSLTEVPKQLRSRGIQCDCVAWYPWQQAAVTDRQYGSQGLGFDSMGIFYLGGQVEVKMHWNLGHVEILSAVTDARNGANQNLDVYAGQNVPGQPWHCYRSKAYNEPACNKDLEARLRDLLTPSTEPEELARLPRGKNYWHCPYLRLKQKKMRQKEWLVDGELHNGAHFPLCVFTENSRARSEEGETKRRQKAQNRSRGTRKGGKRLTSRSQHGQEDPGAVWDCPRYQEQAGNYPWPQYGNFWTAG